MLVTHFCGGIFRRVSYKELRILCTEKEISRAELCNAGDIMDFIEECEPADRYERMMQDRGDHTCP